jgi:hypothetical protein
VGQTAQWGTVRSLDQPKRTARASYVPAARSFSVAQNPRCRACPTLRSFLPHSRSRPLPLQPTAAHSFDTNHRQGVNYIAAIHWLMGLGGLGLELPPKTQNNQSQRQRSSDASEPRPRAVESQQPGATASLFRAFIRVRRRLPPSPPLPVLLSHDGVDAHGGLGCWRRQAAPRLSGRGHGQLSNRGAAERAQQPLCAGDELWIWLTPPSCAVLRRRICVTGL